jgi:hypothetical protein
VLYPMEDYPLSLSLMLWLNRERLFKEFILALKDAKKDPHGIKTLESVAGRPLDQIEKDWRALLAGLNAGSNLVLAQAAVVATRQEEWDEWFEQNRFRFDGDVDHRRHEPLEKPVRDELLWRDPKNRRLTPHYVIYTDLTIPDLRHTQQFFDRFFEWFERKYFRVDQRDLLTMYLFKDEEGYDVYRRRTGGPDTMYGYTLSGNNLIVVNAASGLGTATHELVHHFLMTRLPAPSSFVNEGFAAFFEKFMGHIDADGKLHISVGYFSNWRFPQVKNADLDLKALIESRNADQSQARSFMLYLHRRGKLRDFIVDVKGDVVASLEKSTGSKLTDLEAGWKKWVADQPIDENVNLIPASFIKTQDEWNAWWNANETRVHWNEKEERYEVKSEASPKR